MMITDKNLGRIEVMTIPVPDGYRLLSGTYTFAGKVLLHCQKEGSASDQTQLLVMEDDGSCAREIFDGIFPVSRHANGIRFMPFYDDTRILLGDSILECEPDISDCRSCRLISLKYPWGIAEDDTIFCHWSEIIISPDNEHISWTILGKGFTAACLGRLVRREDCYEIAQAILGYLKYAGVRQVICLDGIARTSPDDVPVACGSGPGSSKMMQKSKFTVMEGGMVKGVTGIMLYEGPEYGMDVTALMVPANPALPDPGASAAFIPAITSMVPGLRVSAKPLLKEADEINKRLTEQAEAEAEQTQSQIYG